MEKEQELVEQNKGQGHCSVARLEFNDKSGKGDIRVGRLGVGMDLGGRAEAAVRSRMQEILQPWKMRRDRTVHRKQVCCFHSEDFPRQTQVIQHLTVNYGRVPAMARRHVGSSKGSEPAPAGHRIRAKGLMGFIWAPWDQSLSVCSWEEADVERCLMCR